MIRLVTIDASGKPILIKDIASASDLKDVAEQARNLIRDCERLAREKAGGADKIRPHVVPYTT